MILAIESSCDESAVALFDPAHGLVGEWVHSQMALHEDYGGVVPDLATREHLRTIGPLLAEVGKQHNLTAVTRVVVTHGPGLAGCLAIGTSSAKALAVAQGVPLAGVNHLRGHTFSPFIALHAEAPERFDEAFAALLPHLGLIVSGGNTLLFKLDEARRITVISSTRDDAAGEALDKGAKLLGLGYPGGPRVEKLAAEGDATAFDFPRGIGKKAELDFSFSGLKTALRYQLEKMSLEEIEARKADLCASYQQAVIDALVRKAKLASRTETFRSVGLSGGVANNRTLRAAMQTMAERRHFKFLAAQPKHTGDNAGMIAFAAWVDPMVQDVAPAELAIHPSMPLAR
ncbi:tRNA (adenosine(37)-N6)-threonylcarbamoyltransferase complex transferase subunit TsaD [Actomonas aquatica]|uniref:tRNA N6-adenosine threonylcarbamoyltransferase n=1 Tax=Actomonas aquatica TaxID=2866162 RepID=A0ABZ1CBT4_9BACT|nr:tRNA (adenosine(37)-N6)-threonylcarbamoyltransferase complex transferase subunit TsaD [Opitutus sp. WL0086]WRQ88953.1 tRNA (adenosine(37)-N6)-threonylcarbamoyltransferase complex transferase subunit TsaD [Opitutus sp. WL0086]